MYSEFLTYVTARVAELNADIFGTANDLGLMTVLDENELPENQTNLSWILKKDNFETDATEAPVYIVNGVIELSFEVANDDTSRYQTIIDTYIFGLVKKLRATRSYKNSNSTIKFELSKIKAQGLKNFSNDILKSEITFEAMYADTN